METVTTDRIETVLEARYGQLVRPLRCLQSATAVSTVSCYGLYGEHDRMPYGQYGQHVMLPVSLRCVRSPDRRNRIGSVIQSLQR